MYDDWFRHRAVWRRFVTPAAIVMALGGAAMSLQFQRQWLVGFVISALGVYELVSSLTHRRRWIDERMSDVRDEKAVSLSFNGETLASTSPNGSGTMRIGGFRGFAQGASGFFLIPDTGISLYVPRAAISPADAYDELVQTLPDLVDKPPDWDADTAPDGKPLRI